MVLEERQELLILTMYLVLGTKAVSPSQTLILSQSLVSICSYFRHTLSSRFTGAAAAWMDTIQHFGSNSVSVAQILNPAIRLAEEGYA
jgi:gamma-glutamyltranspeptidase